MKTSQLSFLEDKATFEALIKEFIATSPQIRAPKTRWETSTNLRGFRRWWGNHGHPELDEETFLQWMLEGVQRLGLRTPQARLFPVKGFLDYLVTRGLLPRNALADLRKGYRFRGYRGIMRDLIRTGSVSAVMAQADHPFSGPLGSSCLSYLESLAALGKQCDDHRHNLRSFERFLREHGVATWSQVDRDCIENWIGNRSDYQRRCVLRVMTGFFLFLMESGAVEESPVPDPGPHRRRSLPPYVFSHEEVRAVLEEASKQPDHRLMPFRGRTYRMVFLTLYTLGLRISEALNLRLSDLDFTQHCLTIGKTKFYKGRVLPFGPRYEAALHAYLNEHPLLQKARSDAFLFPTDSGRTPHLVRESVFCMLERIVKQLGITTPAETRQPCLHSFRHSFASHRVEQWMREGANVEAKMPLLSAFLGHVDAAATQIYLSMTPERLTLINERFEDAVGKEVKA
jgi:site-specific recombinase XerD